MVEWYHWLLRTQHSWQWLIEYSHSKVEGEPYQLEAFWRIKHFLQKSCREKFSLSTQLSVYWDLFCNGNLEWHPVICQWWWHHEQLGLSRKIKSFWLSQLCLRIGHLLQKPWNPSLAKPVIQDCSSSCLFWLLYSDSVKLTSPWFMTHEKVGGPIKNNIYINIYIY